MAERIAVLKEFGSPFEGEQYEVDLTRQFGGYERGDLICSVCPFGATYLPLELEIAIRMDGSLIFRAWNFVKNMNYYLHTREISMKEHDKVKEERPHIIPFVPTIEQIDTVNGLFSGRIKFEGLKIAVGGTVQDICPIDVKREEMLTGKKIYLA